MICVIVFNLDIRYGDNPIANKNSVGNTVAANPAAPSVGIALNLPDIAGIWINRNLIQHFQQSISYISW